MNLKELRRLISSDFLKNDSESIIKAIVKNIIFNTGFKYTFWMRTTKYLYQKKSLFPLFVISYLIHNHYRVKYGIQVPFKCDIGGGFIISHFNNIVVHTNVKIGEKCHISQGVTIGIAKGKVPILGNNVSVCAGAKVIGGVKIGNNVTIGAGAVVVKDVPDNCVVCGNPGKIIKRNGIKVNQIKNRAN